MKPNPGKKKDKTNLSTAGLPQLVTHIPNPDMRINKSDLIRYLGHYKDAIQNKKKDPWYTTLVELIIIFSFFVTSSFKVYPIIGRYLVYVYLVLAACFAYDKLRKSFKKDDSKYKETNPEKMSDIIENNCKK